MHSRIFEVSTEPIPQDEYMTDSYFDYDHWFFKTIADYVMDDEHREGSVKWLLDSLAVGDGLVTIEGDSFQLHEGFHTAYWNGRHRAFLEKAEAMGNITAEQFAEGGASMLLYQAAELHEDKFGFYVVARDDDDLITIDEFIRYAQIGRRYYIGGTVDYHM